MRYLQTISVVGIIAGFVGAAFANPPALRPAPEFTCTEPSGKPLSLAAYSGKVVLVQFLYTTCPHCQVTSRTFAKLQNELGPRGLQVVGVAFNEETEKNLDLVRAYAAANGVNFPIGMALRQNVLPFLGISFMSRFAVPQVVVIDRNGVIRAQSEPLGSEELMDENRLRPLLESLLDEAPVATAKSHKHTQAK